MKEFRRPSGQGAGRGGFDKREQGSDFRKPRTGGYQGSNERPGYGSHKGDHNSGERREMKHQAVCSECNKTCEVPFRPNGSKPVYCKDCFGAKKGAQGSNNDRHEKRDFGGHSHASAPAQAPARDSRIDELKSQMDSMQSKLDRILKSLEGSKTVSEQRQFEKPAMAKMAEKLAVMPKPEAKPAAKKASAKAPAKKVAAPKAPAKKAVKPVAKKKK